MLAGGAGEAGVVRLGEPVAGVRLPGAVREVSRGPLPGRMAVSAAGGTRVPGLPVTVTTGVRPRRPRVRPVGGLRPGPGSPPGQGQAPRSAAVL